MGTEPVRMLGHYRLDEQIGEGGMGVVFRAYDTHLQRAVAVKVLRSDLLADQAARRRFRKEALAISRVEHSHIADVYDFDTQDGLDFLVMELVPGVTLQKMLANGPLPEKQILELAVQLTDALHAAHRRGVIHCDVKPANLRITPDGFLKVLDFGLARFRQTVTASQSTSSGSAPGIAGTVHYMAPEQFEADCVDPRTDIYGTGVVLFETATGQLPFAENSQARLLHSILREPPVPPRALNGRISAELERITLKCLEKDPARRYQTAQELHIDLDRLLHPSKTDRPRPRPRWHPHATWASGAAAIAAAVAVVLLNDRDQKSAPVTSVMLPIVTWPGIERGGSISPDGKWIAFGAAHDGQKGLWVVSESGGEPRLVVADSSAIESQTWSPAGDEIAYISRDDDGTSLRFVSAFVGSQRKSQRLDKTLSRADLVRWIGTSVYLDAGRHGLWRLDLPTEGRHLALGALDADGARRHFDICEAHVSYTLDRDGFVLCSTDLERQKTMEWTPRQSAALWARWLGSSCRQLVYSSNHGGQTDLWRISLDDRATTQITFSSAAEQVEDVSADGTRILFRQTEDRGDLCRMRPGERAQVLRADLQLAWPSVARDRRVVAFQRAKPVQESAPILDAEILVADLASEGMSEALVVVPDGGNPRLSPDGQWLAYVRTAGTRFELWMMELKTQRTWRVTPRFRVSAYHETPRAWWQTTLAWSGPGNTLYFVARSDSGITEIRTLRVATGDESPSEVMVASSGPTRYGDPHVSPDGRCLGYSRWERKELDTWEVHALDLSTGQDRILLQRSAAPGTTLLLLRGWLENGVAVVMDAQIGVRGSGPAAVLAIELTGRTRSLGVVEHAFAGSAHLDPRNATLYITCEDGAEGPHNLYAVSARDGTRRRVTQNTVSGVSFAGVEPVDDGALLYVQQEQNEDLRLIRFGP